MSGIKDMLDSIINNTKTSYTDDHSDDPRVHHLMPETFDAGKFREKLSMYVLKDLVCAMMHDETQDLDNMIDESIMKHIHDDYRGTCYGYLTAARDRLKSPILASVVQEIDDTVDDVAVEIREKKDPSIAMRIDTKELLKDVDNYDELREKLKEVVSKKVVDDVAGVITQSNDAPVFDDIDDKLEPESKDTENESVEDAGEQPQEVQKESVIMKICESIVMEAAINHNPISTNDGLNKAIVEYCIAELDYLTKAHVQRSIYSKYLK